MVCCRHKELVENIWRTINGCLEPSQIRYLISKLDKQKFNYTVLKWLKMMVYRWKHTRNVHISPSSMLKGFGNNDYPHPISSFELFSGDEGFLGFEYSSTIWPRVQTRNRFFFRCESLRSMQWKKILHPNHCNCQNICLKKFFTQIILTLISFYKRKKFEQKLVPHQSHKAQKKRFL